MAFEKFSSINLEDIKNTNEYRNAIIKLDTLTKKATCGTNIRWEYVRDAVMNITTSFDMSLCNDTNLVEESQKDTCDVIAKVLTALGFDVETRVIGDMYVIRNR